jgi:hypothetical protein
LATYVAWLMRIENISLRSNLVNSSCGHKKKKKQKKLKERERERRRRRRSGEPLCSHEELGRKKKKIGEKEAYQEEKPLEFKDFFFFFFTPKFL